MEQNGQNRVERRLVAILTADRVVKGYPNKYLNNDVGTFSNMTLPPPTQIVVFTPRQMRNYR